MLLTWLEVQPERLVQALSLVPPVRSEQEQLRALPVLPVQELSLVPPAVWELLPEQELYSAPG